MPDILSHVAKLSAIFKSVVKPPPVVARLLMTKVSSSGLHANADNQRCTQTLHGN